MSRDGRDTNDNRYDHMWIGEVVDVDDPLFVGRVKVFVPGVYEPDSPWAFPMGHMLGIRDGFFCVPSVGANVVVFCNQGDVDHPYFMPGPFGAPDGNQDRMTQVPASASSVDFASFRFRNFHVTFDGQPGVEKLTVEDITSGTKLEIDRMTGDLLEDVEGDMNVEVKEDLNTTVEEGDETHQVLLGDRTTTVAVGNDTETIGGNKAKNVTGDETDTITGAKTETVLGPAGSTESIPAGAKTVTAGLNVNVTAGLAMLLQSGGLMSLLGSGVSINSAGGPTTIVSGGLVTKTFLGGILENVTGVEVKTVSGTYTITVAGLMSLIASTLVLGVPLDAKKLVTEEMFALWANNHTHPVAAAPGTSGAPDQKVVLGATGPDVELNDVTTQNVTAS